MIQKETNLNVHLEVTETQGYLYEIHTKKIETHMCGIHTNKIGFC